MNQKLLDEMKDLISRIDGGGGKDTGADDSEGGADKGVNQLHQTEKMVV
ncbi:hypothetical protein CoNPh34_CDS0014 [Staphylococcus phage S-CoN_Ph34]|nr:hypothetical protein CoNPh34_CDS0014 [Staphylococcus phage S-CoN_Ph34]